MIHGRQWYVSNVLLALTTADSQFPIQEVIPRLWSQHSDQKAHLTLFSSFLHTRSSGDLQRECWRWVFLGEMSGLMSVRNGLSLVKLVWSIDVNGLKYSRDNLFSY